MFLLDDHLLDLARQGKIAADVACMKAQDPRIMREKLGEKLGGKDEAAA